MNPSVICHDVVAFYPVKNRKFRSVKLAISLLFPSSHFSFLVFGQFWRQSYKNTKILCNLCLHFARQDEQDRQKKSKEKHAIKVNKIPKTKDENMG